VDDTDIYLPYDSRKATEVIIWRPHFFKSAWKYYQGMGTKGNMYFDDGIIRWYHNPRQKRIDIDKIWTFSVMRDNNSKNIIPDRPFLLRNVNKVKRCKLNNYKSNIKKRPVTKRRKKDSSMKNIRKKAKRKKVERKDKDKTEKKKKVIDKKQIMESEKLEEKKEESESEKKEDDEESNDRVLKDSLDGSFWQTPKTKKRKAKKISHYKPDPKDIRKKTEKEKEIEIITKGNYVGYKTNK